MQIFYTFYATTYVPNTQYILNMCCLDAESIIFIFTRIYVEIFLRYPHQCMFMNFFFIFYFSSTHIFVTNTHTHFFLSKLNGEKKLSYRAEIQKMKGRKLLHIYSKKWTKKNVINDIINNLRWVCTNWLLSKEEDDEEATTATKKALLRVKIEIKHHRDMSIALN